MANVTSPISGQIIKINIQVGQEITDEDTELMVMEAMKMENIVYGDVGTVKEIKVKVGDRVQEEAVLAIIE
jgi:biotin carboxyl carrier protein